MDYKKLGLKCGIEIHQQLEGKKLFCNCPTKLKDNQPDYTVNRKMRAAAGEEGEVDVAAVQEQEKHQTFIYEGYHNTICLVELDEEPPHPVNQDALHTALQFSRMVNANISEIVEFMRKTVVDGSNTSGFQRTALIARNGKIKTSEGEVGIINISLEEDACRIIDEATGIKTYRLDRLGIPLIEVGTAPDIQSPEQCQEAAKKLGLILRSLPGVKRGLGTIRQDVNVSIRGGRRIEIKGAQDLKSIPLLVELEIKRQLELLKLKDELRGIRLNGLEPVELSFLFKEVNSKEINSKEMDSKEVNSKIISKTLEKGGKVLGTKLSNFSGVLGRELLPGYRVGTEFSGRAKIKAGVGGIFHSDELPNYGITEREIKFIRKKLKCSPADAFVLVADSEEKARKALKAVHERALELLDGVPKEVRKANADGTTSFMRPMPGAARMYPETDIPLVRPEASNIELPELLEDKIVRYQKKFGLSLDLAEFVAKSEHILLFEEIVAAHQKIKPAFIAETLISTPLEIKRNYALDSEKLTAENFKELFEHLDSGKIHKDIVLDVLIDMIKGKFELRKYEKLSTEDIHSAIKVIVSKNKDAPFGALMGQCMKALAGKASGQLISEELKKILERGH